MPNAKRGTATPSAKATISVTAEGPMRWLAPTTVTAAGTGPVCGMESRPGLSPSISPSIGLLGGPGQPNEGTLEDVPDRGEDQTKGHHDQYRQTHVSEKVTREPQQAEWGCPDQGEGAGSSRPGLPRPPVDGQRGGDRPVLLDLPRPRTTLGPPGYCTARYR